MKRAITILLLLAMLTGSLFSCGGSPAETTAADTENTSTVTETVPETEETSYLEGLASADYEGADFRMLGRNLLGGVTLPTTLNLHTGELNGEVVNDALYNRDLMLEEKYNVVITGTVDDNTSREAIKNMITAGDAAYDMIWEDMAYSGIYMVTNSLVHPLNYVDNIDLSKPYWEQTANEALKISDSIYFATGPISPRYYGSAYIIMFNRDMASDLGLEDYYTLVEEGKWTIDRMMEDARTATYDSDGDGTITDEDRIGIAYEVLTPESILFGAGYHYIEQENGEMKITLEDENLVSLMQQLISFFQEECAVWVYNGGPYDEVKMYSEGHLLFYNPVTFCLADFRELEYDFGILPMPKLNSEQENYISYGQPWATATPYVPVTNTGDTLSMTGMIIEAMAAYGLEVLRPAVFEDVIQLKSTRDEQSGKIINLLFDTITFDLMPILNPGSLYGELQGIFTGSLGKKEVTSMYATKKEAAMNALAKTVADFKEMEESYK
ncbi:MAG: hypothetical protein IJ480_05060 [Clostridia bacterium]|nr:hypothetical protein [Clostridia bacterium]